PVGAPPPDRVPGAPRQDPQLGADRPGAAGPDVVAPRLPSLPESCADQRREPGVVALATVVEARTREISNPAAGRGVPELPFLLVAAPVDPLVKPSDPFGRAGPHRHL